MSAGRALLRRIALPVSLAAAAAIAPPPDLRASSHREAPGITEQPKVDGTDFYMFRSYEPGRDAFVTFVANYVPLQDPYGGPNYFALDPRARYEIKIDNDGDAREDITFRFRFKNERQNMTLGIGPPGNQVSVAVPVINVGPIAAGDTSALNVIETYTVDILRGHEWTSRIRNAKTGESTFEKPVDNIGMKSLPDYEAYAAARTYPIRIPGCHDGRMFVGQRKDSFVVNLGEVFDLVNVTNPLGPVDAERDDLANKNVTSLILEVPIACVTGRRGPVIGAWTTASLPEDDKHHDDFVQVSRLSNPLVNELVIGLKDKDRFNGSQPKNDAQFATYVTNPTLPAILEILFGGAGVKAPTLFPRSDLVAAFLTGISGLNANGSVAEMIRLNTATPPTPAAGQNNLGVIGGDVAGFPNGRRPGDDVVDIALRVVMGKLLPLADAPSGQLPFTDGAFVDASRFATRFPYLTTPIPGSPNDTP